MSDNGEFDRLREAFRRKSQQRTIVQIATVIDVSPRAENGYVVGRLRNGDQVYVHCWTTDAVAIDNQIFVIPISNEPYSWWVLAGVNTSNDPVTIPFQRNLIDAAAIAPHAFSLHTDNLDWSRVDTSANKVNLTTAVTGILPASQQAAQAQLQQWIFSIGPLAPGEMTDGVWQLNHSLVWMRRLTISGGSECVLVIEEQASAGAFDVVPNEDEFLVDDEDQVYRFERLFADMLVLDRDTFYADAFVRLRQYGITPVNPPFIDSGGIFLVDPTGQHQYPWIFRNTGNATSTFTVTLDLIAWPVGVS